MTLVTRRDRCHWHSLLVLAVVGAVSCGKPSSPPPNASGQGAPLDKPGCPSHASAPNPLPGVTELQRTAAYWVARQPHPDDEVLSIAAIRAHDAAFLARDAREPDTDALAPFDLTHAVDSARLLTEVNARLAYLRTRIVHGELVTRGGEKPDVGPFAPLTELPPLLASALGGELRVALALVPLHCGPDGSGLYKSGDVQEAFDRNLCSSLRPQEALSVLASFPNGMTLVRSRATLGWIDAQAPLSPPVPPELRATFASAPRLRVRTETSLGFGSPAVTVPANTFLAASDNVRPAVATATGFGTGSMLEDATTLRPLTRRALLEEAFRYLDTPYGWGGRGGGRDCSEFLSSVFASFGLSLPRHSGAQARAGTMSIDLATVTEETQRLALIDAAAERGVVLLSFPGHIMLYLGRSAEGTPMVMHAFAEYLEPGSPTCGGETLVSVDRVQVSDLRLGGGTSRKSFLERLGRITILGTSPGPSLAGVATLRPPAPTESRGACEEAESHADVMLLVVPGRAHPGQPLRVIVASGRDLGSVELVFDGPDGARIAPPLHRTGGPPYGYWAEVTSPAVGEWTVRLADGPLSHACQVVRVHERAAGRERGAASAWSVRQKWTPAFENLYGVFVEQLFAYPFDDRTWKNLESLLRDGEHNLLSGHFGVAEEQRIALEPDCADLPYFLRAYFSWKLGLPFAYRHCNRGRKGEAPYCDKEVHSNLSAQPEGRDATEKFATFARSNLANGVHSGTGRTSPRDSVSDHYSVPLTRDALTPGSVFADPYGHGYVLAGWVPQGLTTHGMLIGADAQPDGTIGRRRFWRGTFLYSPDTTEAGAGFKHFRPVWMKGGKVTSIANERIAEDRPGFTPWSLEPYELDKDAWYDTLENLINPRPLAANDALEALLAALFEQLKARVTSIENGQEYMRAHRSAIEMPHGHSLFETSGAWEDYSTPSRDMRLLIALDTVMGFPQAVQRQPARFGLPSAPAELEARLQALRERITSRVAELSFEYPRSDGSRFKLTVGDVVARQRSLELAYNPNDCAEARWGAAEGSDELATCTRHAPTGQARAMEKNRVWFATRTRPTR